MAIHDAVPFRRARAVCALTLSMSVLLAGCGGADEPQSPGASQPSGSPTQPPSDSAPSDSAPSDSAPSDSAPSGSGTTGSGPTGPEDERPGRPRVVRIVAEDLRVPWGVDFLPDGSAVVTERDTRRVLRVTPQGNGPARVRELGVIDQAAPEGEAGLLGVAVSPDFGRDRTLFLYVTTAEDNRVLRTEVRGDRLGEPEVVLDGIPKGFIHDGGRLAFGPDGHLFVSTGETGEPELAQDPDSLAGKILRITPDGEPAPGNPDPGSPVWTSGHRNVQGLAFDDAGNLWASEFGDQEFDELNLIERGRNYGWPRVEGTGGGQGLTDPQVTWGTDEASPSGLAFADGGLWLGALQGERLWRVDVRDGRASAPTPFFVGEYGRIRSVETTPRGDLWITTSNHDGRGSPAADDDRILLVTTG